MQFNFDASQYAPQFAMGSSLPPGRFTVVITGAESKPTKDGNSGYLAVEFTVTSGPHSGQKMTSNFNIWNTNQQAAEIAHKQLSAVCHCIGRYRFSDTSELFNIPMQIEVGPQKDRPEYSELKDVFDANGNPPNKAGQGPQARAAAPAAVTHPQPQQAAPASGGWGAPQSAADAPAAAAATPAPAAAGGWQAPGTGGGGAAAAGGWRPPQ